jgi:two-component system, NarL family, response regulator LiaR
MTLRQALREHGLDVVGEASNGRSGARLALELKPDVVVMDLDMPQMNGIDATRAIVEQEPEARILMFTI